MYYMVDNRYTPRGGINIHYLYNLYIINHRNLIPWVLHIFLHRKIFLYNYNTLNITLQAHNRNAFIFVHTNKIFSLGLQDLERKYKAFT